MNVYGSWTRPILELLKVQTRYHVPVFGRPDGRAFLSDKLNHHLRHVCQLRPSKPAEKSASLHGLLDRADTSCNFPFNPPRPHYGLTYLYSVSSKTAARTVKSSYVYKAP